ncbi:MAG: hypothetical protein ABI528_02350 [bacterium]
MMLMIQSYFTQVFAQGVNLDGKSFKGTATEIKQFGADSIPKVIDAVINFSEGKISVNITDYITMMDEEYSSEVDDRRMSALTVMNFYSNSTGSYFDENVEVGFSGSVFGDGSLSGNISLRFPDNREVKFFVIAEAGK